MSASRIIRTNTATESENDAPKMVDIMDGSERWTINVQNHGFVSLVDCMPRRVPEGRTGDFAIVQAARVSYGQGTKKVSEDEGLIRYLMRHSHNTPMEMVEFKFCCRMPIFVARQWIRHRTASVNEYSARYSVVQDYFFKFDSADDVKLQSKINNQGRSETSVQNATAQEFLDYLDKVNDEVYKQYEKFIEQGVSREQARILLPVSAYTEWYWKTDLHNLFHFLRLRMDSHAQKEIQDYANAMYELIEPIVPIACKAFRDYRLNSQQLTGLEIDSIKNRTGVLLGSKNKREQAEFTEKLKVVGLSGDTLKQLKELESDGSCIMNLEELQSVAQKSNQLLGYAEDDVKNVAYQQKLKKMGLTF